MRVLVTGSAGFIGYNLCNKLLEKKHIVYGIDNFDNYYSSKYKKERILNLKKNKKFIFKKIDISHKQKLKSFLSKLKFDIIIHLAAQAGVRYSYINPDKYIKTNIEGYLNLILHSNKKKLKKIIYASSSSVYGDSKKFPLNENEKLNPINIYGVSKMLNEKISMMYSKIFKIPFIGLRFFTIYGEWGRPDMFLFKLFKSYKKKNFYLNNYGNHERDFTYVEDVSKIILKLININTKDHHIFNISSNNPININRIIKYFSKNKLIKIKKIKKHKADMIKTHGDNLKILKLTKIKLNRNFYLNFDKTFEWYKNFAKSKLI